MNCLPRIALGTVQVHEDPRFVVWALLNVLDRLGLLVQSFSSQSCYEGHDAALVITGQGRRHLDSWLMPPDMCAELFFNGSQCADICVVDGQFDVAMPGQRAGGSLDALCAWLDLPQVAIINAERLRTCCLPRVPAGVDAIILDKVPGVREFCHLQTVLEPLLGAPVIGAMGAHRELRAAVADVVTGPEMSSNQGAASSAELCHALGSALASRFQLGKFLDIAMRRSFSPVDGRLFREDYPPRPLNIAVAFDEAFVSLFPDTLDVFESQGATINFFSPLHDESLPRDTDVVYLGGGQFEGRLGELAANICMKESLWAHVASGGRIYAESAGLAYICRAIATPCGRYWPMIGLLPAVGRYRGTGLDRRAVEFATMRGSWLFNPGEHVRGYLDAGWGIQPDGCSLPLAPAGVHGHHVLGDYQIVGSRIHLDFAARPELAARFFQPCTGSSLNPVS